MPLPLIGVTVGDPAGIGPEIVAKAVADEAVHKACRLVLYGHPRDFERIAGILPARFRVKVADDPAAAVQDPGDGVPLIVPTEAAGGDEEISLGKVSAAAGRASYAYLSRAIRDALHGRIDAIATAPINKEALRAAGIPYVDHTEILEKLTGSTGVLTMFITGRLRIFFVTRHVPLREACDLITTERVLDTLRRGSGFLSRLGLSNPRLALAALNPHASDGGLMGTEEATRLLPAVTAARNEGIDVVGPVPADSVFVQALRGRYDAVVALYHDQGHIAAKVHDFERTVSLTLGLPFLRVSVDHGTAFDIAGKGVASETSMVEAIQVAAQYAYRWKRAGG